MGSYLRVAYYCMTLKRCTSKGYIGFGSFFAHPEAELGVGYYIGAYTIIGMAKIGDHATIASHVSILSGKNQHGTGKEGNRFRNNQGFLSRYRLVIIAGLAIMRLSWRIWGRTQLWRLEAWWSLQLKVLKLLRETLLD